jgi:glycosyltransferase involved in cell wall biosynthesis
VSDEVKEAFLKTYPSCSYKTKVFHNLLDTKQIIKKSHERIKDMPRSVHGKEVFNLLTVGRLTYQKGFDVAVYALKKIIDNGYPVHWYIIGEGPEYGVLTESAQNLGISDRIHFLGVRANPYPYFKRADIYVHATRFEGKSIAIQEAQILDCAIIASDCSGNREQITNKEDGLLCDFEADAIADAIIYLLKNPKEISKFKKASSEKQLNHFEELEYIEELL